jgi:hypothetical protein
MSTGEYEKELALVNARILEAAAHFVQDAGGEFLLVHLACGPEINSLSPHGPKPTGPVDDEAVCAGAAQAANASFLGTAASFREAGKEWTVGHYGETEARFVAQLVYAKIQQLPSWRKQRDTLAGPSH